LQRRFRNPCGGQLHNAAAQAQVLLGSDFMACRTLAPVAVAIFEEMAMAHGLESPFACYCGIWTPFVRPLRSELPIRIDEVNKPVASY
jgi:hypothetical protein